MSALNVRYRDVRIVVPFIIQLGLYVSPVGFVTELVTNEWRVIYSLNPLVGVIDGFRWCFFGGEKAYFWPGAVCSFAVSSVLWVSGYYFFLRSERKFADII
jgi:lipopolysaccharide transport system permease protein